jgi:peptidoglycan/LPS O-acetylase OafA/YrhL
LFIGVAGHYKEVAEARLGVSAPLAFIVLGVAGTWGASYLSYRFIEMPGRRYVSAVLNGKPKGSPLGEAV